MTAPAAAVTAVDALALPPVEDDHDTAGFFAAARRGELAVKVCDACGSVLHLPRQWCTCGSAESSWQTVAGRGALHSWTVTEHQIHPAFPVPYTVVLVDLDEVAARFVGMLPGRPEGLRVGLPLRVRFDRAPDGTTLPQWELVPDDEPAG